MKNEFPYRKLAEGSFLSGMLLVGFVFLNILITAVSLIANVSVLAITPVVALVLAMAATLYFASRSENLQSLGAKLGVIGVAVLAIAVCVGISMLLYDRSYDGNYYHKVAIGSLTNGWNPLRQDLVAFWQQAQQAMPVTNDDSLWVEHYAKASYFFAAPMYALTGSIEAGKSVNLISLLALVLLWAGYLLHQRKHPLFVLVFSVVLASCPVFTAQLFSNYIDLLVGMYLFLIILAFFVFEEEDFFGRGAVPHLLLFMSLCIIINIKFSSFGYGGLFCLGYYLWYVYRVWKKSLAPKELLRLTANGAAAVLVGVGVIGLSVYGKNLLDHGHPFYPLFGEGKIDIMGINQPACFMGMSAVEKFFYATFSRGENIVAASGAVPTLKIPFTVTQSELWDLPCVDLRMSGYGVWFSGILLLCVALYGLTAGSVRKNQPKLFALTAIPLLITLVMIPCLSESWWARYFPQLYLLILFVLLYLEAGHTKLKNGAIVVLTALLLVNNGLTFATGALSTVRKTIEINGELARMEQAAAATEAVVVLKAGEIRGAVYNALDRLERDRVHVVVAEDDPMAAYATEAAYSNFVYWGIADE